MNENNQKNIQRTVEVEKDGAKFSLEVHMSNLSLETEKRVQEYLNQLYTVVTETI